MIKAVEVAIRDSGLGLNPQTEGQVIRVPLPPLTQERRNDLVKAAGKYSEGTRVAVRGVRRDGMEQIKAWEKKHEIGEDDAKSWAEEVQKLTDQYIKQVDQALAEKEKDIRQVSGYKGPQDVHPLPRQASRRSRRCGHGRAAARACRHHHGWQPALGGGAWPAGGA